MSGGIEEPYAIAHLPSPLDAEHGRILAAPVHSLLGSRKRKRHEIAVAVDGESVSIYNARNQRLSSSYPLPPQAYLAAPPCSIYCKKKKQRQTYITTRNALHDANLRLVNITEDFGKPEIRKERKLRSGDIVGLDAIQNDSVLVCYKNGNVDCIRSDLSGARWQHTGTSGVHVEHAVVSDLATARRGLLKGREDVLAMLDQTGHTDGDISAMPMLLQILRADSRRQVRVSLLKNIYGDSLQTHHSPTEELVSYDLPSIGSKEGRDQEAEYDLHVGTGMLYQRFGGRLNIIDLSGTLPRLMAKLGRKGTPRVDGFARLSPATVLTLNSNRLAVCETKFSSVLSSLEYQSAGSGGTVSSLHIISQFTDLSIVVALSGTNLVAFQVGDILDDGQRAKAQGPLLIDVLGKGSKLDGLSGATLSAKQSKRRQRLHDWKAKVNVLIDEGDIESLEDLVAQDLHINDDELGDEHTHGLTNGSDQLHRDTTWTLPPHTYDPQHTDSRKAHHILGSLFTWQKTDEMPGPNSHKLSLKLLPKNVLRWLAMAGYMTHTNIERALQLSSDGSEAKPRVAQGDVVTALKMADPSFTMLCDLLSLPIHWDLVEVVRGLQLLIRSFEAKFLNPIGGLLTSASNDGDIAMIDGDDEARLQAEVDAATRQLDEAQSMLDNGLTNRSRACQVLLFRLHAFPHADISRTLRALLSQEELIFFIAILRLELSDAGWTRTYGEAERAAGGQEVPISNDLEPSNHAIRTIADLCSCAIDAIGLSGWLVGLSGDIDETARLISEMRNEVSAAAEGLVGMEVVETMLGDMGRLPPQQKSRRTGADRAVGKYSFEQIRL